MSIVAAMRKLPRGGLAEFRLSSIQRRDGYKNKWTTITVWSHGKLAGKLRVRRHDAKAFMRALMSVKERGEK